jgi:hypothetical protein
VADVGGTLADDLRHSGMVAQVSGKPMHEVGPHIRGILKMLEVVDDLQDNLSDAPDDDQPDVWPDTHNHSLATSSKVNLKGSRPMVRSYNLWPPILYYSNVQQHLQRPRPTQPNPGRSSSSDNQGKLPQTTPAQAPTISQPSQSIKARHAKREDKLEGLLNALYHEANDTTFGLGVWAYTSSYGREIKFDSEDEAIEWLLRVCQHDREVVVFVLREHGGDVAETYLALMEGLV